MRRLVVAHLAMAFVLAQTGVGMAVWGDGPGCGAGKMLFGQPGVSGESEPKSVLMQNLGSTTNAPSQPFALSTGTSGCTNNGMIVKGEQANVFASLNFDNLSQEIAQGQGEHLTSLAALLGIPAEHQAEFFSMAQENYKALIQTGENAPSAMLIALQNAMKSHPVLAKLNTDR